MSEVTIGKFYRIVNSIALLVKSRCWPHTDRVFLLYRCKQREHKIASKQCYDFALFNCGTVLAIVHALTF